jgi:hypothetical protein
MCNLLNAPRLHGKLLPTFGGCVITAAKCDTMKADQPGVLKMEVDYTTSRKVPGLSGLPLIGDSVWKVKVPVGGTLLLCMCVCGVCILACLTLKAICSHVVLKPFGSCFLGTGAVQHPAK